MKIAIMAAVAVAIMWIGYYAWTPDEEATCTCTTRCLATKHEGQMLYINLGDSAFKNLARCSEGHLVLEHAGKRTHIGHRGQHYLIEECDHGPLEGDYGF